MQINLLVEGGNMKPGPALSQKLGPTGINMGQIIQKVNQATESFKGLKVPIEVTLDLGTKEISIEVFSPPVSELIKKELGIEKGSGKQDELKVANASVEQIISVAKTKLPSVISKDLKASVKEVVGSCVSLGILIESKPAKDFMEDVFEGKYDKEISEEKTETSPERRKELDDFFSEISEEQEAKIKQAEREAEEKKAEEEKTEAEDGEKKEEKEEEKAK